MRKEVRLKRVYEAASPQDGRRFLVDRLWPRGKKKEALCIESWLKDVAPSTELCRWFSHQEERWEEFCERYRQELEQNPDAWRALLAAQKEGPVTLVYAAKDVDHNNAVALREYLKRKSNRK